MRLGPLIPPRTYQISFPILEVCVYIYVHICIWRLRGFLRSFIFPLLVYTRNLRVRAKVDVSIAVTLRKEIVQESTWACFKAQILYFNSLLFIFLPDFFCIVQGVVKSGHGIFKICTNSNICTDRGQFFFHLKSPWIRRLKHSPFGKTTKICVRIFVRRLIALQWKLKGKSKGKEWKNDRRKEKSECIDVIAPPWQHEDAFSLVAGQNRRLFMEEMIRKRPLENKRRDCLQQFIKTHVTVSRLFLTGRSDCSSAYMARWSSGTIFRRLVCVEFATRKVAHWNETNFWRSALFLAPRPLNNIPIVIRRVYAAKSIVDNLWTFEPLCIGYGTSGASACTVA